VIAPFILLFLMSGCPASTPDEKTTDATGMSVGETTGTSLTVSGSLGTSDDTSDSEMSVGPSGTSESTGDPTTSGDPTESSTGDPTESSTGDPTDDPTDDPTGGTGGDEPPPCDFYSSPSGGGPDADGSQEQPWPALAQLAAEDAIPSEGVLCLLDGAHGDPVIQGVNASEGTMIRAVNRHLATVGTLRFIAVSGLDLWGLKVDAAGAIDPGQDQRQSFLVTGDVASQDIRLIEVRVESAPSSVQWDQQAWVYEVRSGIDFHGPNITIQDSEIVNTYHALLLRGDGALVERSVIDNFGGDGIRGLGSNSRYSWNLVRDAYIDEYEIQHDDAFQAYKLEGDLKIANVTIDHNQFILFADPLTEFVVANELVGTLMQGVIITDGYADGWVVENNLVVNGQSHGISLFGARNCRVQNNTVVAHPDFVPDTGPWIRLADQTKTGQSNFDNVIRNNIAQMLTPWDYDVSSTVEANMEGPWPVGFFVEGTLDFRLAPASPAVDAGIDAALADFDLDREPRHVGAAVDAGAYEQQ